MSETLTEKELTTLVLKHEDGLKMTNSTLAEVKTELETLVTIKEELQELSQLSKDIKVIKDIVTLWNDGEGFIHTINRVGVGVKWLLLLGAGLTACYGFFKAVVLFLSRSV